MEERSVLRRPISETTNSLSVSDRVRPSLDFLWRWPSGSGDTRVRERVSAVKLGTAYFGHPVSHATLAWLIHQRRESQRGKRIGDGEKNATPSSTLKEVCVATFNLHEPFFEIAPPCACESMLSNRRDNLRGVAERHGLEEILKRPATGQVNADATSCFADACTDLEQLNAQRFDLCGAHRRRQLQAK